ncbi:hypothetical protein GGR50DRAFT_692803 [Xylaria sp. CBS 124048]|nr:hypothetical protein GGR50DRAFT_692803 [Xylaria sp. CBS 124048]
MLTELRQALDNRPLIRGQFSILMGLAMETAGLWIVFVSHSFIRNIFLLLFVVSSGLYLLLSVAFAFERYSLLAVGILDLADDVTLYLLDKFKKCLIFGQHLRRLWN